MRSLLPLLLTAALSAPLGAQLRADPGTVINGRVAVRVYVALSDESVAYVPMRNVQLRFFRTTADTVVTVHTDDAGTATALLQPGEYRLISSSPVNWKGTRYYWSRLVQVRPGVGAIELNSASAERTEAVEVAPAAGDSPLAERNADGQVIRKDPGVATLYSFFAPGVGHLYARERGKGAALFGLSIVGLATGVSAMSCASSADCDPTTASMALGAAGMLAFLGSWAYGMLDADDAARRYNEHHGVTLTAARAIIAPGSHGGVRLGIAMRTPR